MKINEQGLANRAEWEAKGYDLPKFDRAAAIANTKERPFWVHFGVGNLFRAFHCNIAQRLLNAGIIDTGIVGVEGFDYEIVEKMNRPHDDLSILVTLKADGNVEKTVIACLCTPTVFTQPSTVILRFCTCYKIRFRVVVIPTYDLYSVA